MKEMTPTDLKEVQLHILDYVDFFCRKNNIQYTLAFGTLLGAVRHGGFIPWDDDIDIQLLRSEYNKFTQLWNANKGQHPYELVNIESGNSMGYPFGKIHDPQTVTYIGKIERTGVFIDVFPVDYVLDEYDYKSRSAKVSTLYKERNACLAWMQARDANISFLKKIKIYLQKPRKSFDEISVEISRLSQEVKKKTDYVYDIVLGQYAKNLIPSQVYESYKDIKFEDRVYRSVEDCETVLECIYGDWRTPPPIENRVAHHCFKAYWR